LLLLHFCVFFWLVCFHCFIMLIISLCSCTHCHCDTLFLFVLHFFFHCVPLFCLGTPHHGVCGGFRRSQCSSPWCCGGASYSWCPHCVVHGVQLLVTFLIVMFMMMFNYSHHSWSWCFSLFHCGVHGITSVCGILCCGVHDATIIAQGLLVMFRCTWCI